MISTDDPSTGSGTDPSTGSGTDPSASSGTDPSAGPVAEPVEAFPPTLREVMLRPRWIGMLLLCLVVAGVFAWLGQWQLGRAIDTDPPPPGATEEVRPLAEVAAPGEYLSEPLVGQRVTVEGTWVPGDFLVVESRYNDGVEGYWVTGQLRLADEPSRPPRSPSLSGGRRRRRRRSPRSTSWNGMPPPAAAEPVTITGRLISDEGPALPPSGADPQTMTRMSPAALLGRWQDVDGLDVYRPYLASEVAHRPARPTSPRRRPTESSAVNWLNIFYAASGRSSPASRSTSGTASPATRGRRSTRTSRMPRLTHPPPDSTAESRG